MRSRIRWSVIGLLGLIFMVGAGICAVSQHESTAAEQFDKKAHAALSTTVGRLRLPGLQEPVEVLRDRWGVPHIYARNQHDLFFAQGFVAAQDRLFQMEIWKRAGQGRLAEVLGDWALPRDIAARLTRYRGSMDAEYRSYAPDTREVLSAFTAGINAYIERRLDPKGPGLPIEFQLAGFRPELWRPNDCLTRMATLSVTGNATEELALAHLVALLGPKKAASLQDFDPPATLEPPAGEDLTGLSPVLIKGFVGTDSRVGFPANFEGSNNWAISGKMTSSGKPLLGNDPHRTIALPSLRYIVHLHAPGWDVAGATEPALPGVSIGHNQDIAWGLTVFPIDQEDLFLEELNPQNTLEYRTAHGWARMQVVRETFRVRGGKDVTKELEFTVHGPVLWEDGKRALALHWVGAEPGTAPYLAGISVDRAHNWPEFLAAMARWKTPPENLVYADGEGNIGEESAGLTPLRKKGNGLLPAPGWAGYEWAGFVPFSQLPRQFNPRREFIATANNKTIGPNYPYKVGFAWSADRIARINQVLDGARDRKRALDVNDMAALQNDVVSLPAQKLTRLLALSSAANDIALKLLEDWNGSLEMSSPAAALYEIWLRHLRSAILDQIAPHAQPGSIYLGADSLARLMEDPSADFFGENPNAARGKILRETLTAAYAEFESVGPDPSVRNWGKLHTVRFRHALDHLPGLQGLLDLGPFARPGDGTTVDATAFTSANFDQIAGASYREILDISDWDRSLVVNAPGESGQPGSRHYGDLAPLWRNGKYFPLAYSRQAVEHVTTERLELLPENH
ncbi:MAG: penicillin acylase family protein [Candidatus Acidiferrales bacterium]